MVKNLNLYKQDSWREKDVTLEPGLQTIYFDDTKPNHVHFNNLGASTLYVSANVTPSNLKYDRVIQPYKEGLLARQNPKDRVMVYVEGADPCDVRIVSFMDDINPASLQAGTTISTSGDGGGGTDGYVTISGHTVPLPSGNNNIGQVTITSLPTLPEGYNHIGEVTVLNLPTLPAGVNHIGSVDVDALPSLPTGSNQIGRVLIDNSVTIDSMPPVEVTSNPVRAKHHAYENTISTTTVTWDLTEGGTVEEDMVEINYLANDGDTDLYLTFDDDVVSTTPGQGKNGVVRLKPEEVLNNFNRQVQKMNFLRASGSGIVRVTGV